MIDASRVGESLSAPEHVCDQRTECDAGCQPPEVGRHTVVIKVGGHLEEPAARRNSFRGGLAAPRRSAMNDKTPRISRRRRKRNVAAISRMEPTADHSDPSRLGAVWGAETVNGPARVWEKRSAAIFAGVTTPQRSKLKSRIFEISADSMAPLEYPAPEKKNRSLPGCSSPAPARR